MKLYTNKLDHPLFYFPACVRQATNQLDIEVVIMTPEKEEGNADFKAKRAHGKFPMLELDDGTMIYESNAIAIYLARRSALAGALLGYDKFEQAQVNQWLGMNAQNWGSATAVFYDTLGFKWDPAAYNQGVKEIKEAAKKMNQHLQGKTFLVGNRFTLADMACFMPLIFAFAFVLDPGFRKAMPEFSAWFARCAAQSCVMNTCGAVKMCEKPLKPIDTTNLPKVEAPPKPASNPTASGAAPAKEEKKADDDEFDPFADDDEIDEEEYAAKEKRMAEIAAKAKKNAKVVIAKSIVVWEVKPWGEETDLDVLAKKILGIEMDGLFWKTEYKKEPIAYGVFKIAIGATIEDDKVSTDVVQEMIEAFEDEVQSVDIQSFNKL